MRPLILMLTAVGALALAVPATAVSAAGPGSGHATFAEEYAALHARLLEAPDDPDLMARFAYVATRLGNYEAAIATFERMLLINPDLPSARLEIGVLYYRLGDYPSARIYLEDVRASARAGDAARARAGAYLDEIADRLDGQDFSGAVMAGIRYQSNATGGAFDEDVLPPGSLLARDDDLNAFLAARGAHEWDLGTAHGEAWISHGRFYGTKQFDFDRLDLIYVDLDTGPRLAVAPVTFDALYVRPFAIARTSVVDGDLLSFGGGGGVEIEHEYGDDGLAGLRYTGFYRSYDATPAHPTIDLHTGFEHGVEIYGVYHPAEDVTLRGEAGYTRNEAEAAFYAHDRAEVRAAVDVLYDNPLWDAPWPWRVTLAGGYEHRDYDAFDPVVAFGTVREDHRYRVSVANNFQVSRDWSVYLQVEYLDRQSNVAIYEYDNVSALIAARRRF